MNDSSLSGMNSNTNPFEVLADESQQHNSRQSSPQRYGIHENRRNPNARSKRIQEMAIDRGYRSEPSSLIANDSTMRRRHHYPPLESHDDEDMYSESRFADHDGERQMDDVKGAIRSVKQDTLSSTRNALGTITDAQGIAASTLGDLGEQASQIANVERDIGEAKSEAERAAEQAGQLKRLNRSIFLPTFKNPFQRKARARRQLEDAQQKHVANRVEQGTISKFEYQSQTRIARAQQPPTASPSQTGRSESDRKRYQFEPDAEDDAMEDEIDQNLDEIGHVTGHLKNMATSMRAEIDSQNETLGRIQDKIDPINQDIFTTTHRINKIK